MANLVGTTLGQYKITALLGEGGMADVYRARQESLKRDVAIKVMRLQLSINPEFLMRFQREAQTVALLNHPHIIRIYDYGEQQNITYLVMDYLTGGSLADIIKRERSLTPSDASLVLDQISSALDHAHRRGIVHRDLKPHNILFDESGSSILTDFGIAKLMDDTSIHTQTGVAIGTPAYMAPEQWQGLPIDARTDVYAMGVIVYEMLTGHVPYTGTSPVTIMHRAMNEPPRPLSAYRSDLSEAVEAVMVKALAKTQETRYQTAGELAAAFRLAISSIKAPAQPSPVMSYDDERTMAVDRQTPPKQPPSRSLTAEQAARRKTEQDFPPVNSPAPRTQVSSSRSRGLVTAIGALLALVLLGGAGALLLPRLLPAAQLSTDTPAATFTPSESPTPSYTPSSTPTETVTFTATPTETSTATVDPLVYTETAQVALVLQTIGAMSSQTVQAENQVTEIANQTAAALRATEDALKIEGTVHAFIDQTSTARAVAQMGTDQALGQTSTSQAALQMAAMTGTAFVLAPTQTVEAELTVQAISAELTVAAQTAIARATASAGTLIAQAIQSTQTAAVVIATQTAEASKRGDAALIASTRTLAAATAEAVRTQGAATLRALMNGTAVTELPASYYTEQMLALINLGSLDTIQGQIAFKLSEWKSNVTTKNQIKWDQWSSSYGDYVMGVQFTWDAGDAANECGLVARVAGQSFYAFSVSQDGQFRYQMLKSNEWQSAKTKSSKVSVKTGLNTMVLVARGNTYTVVINDDPVGTYTESTLTTGNIGVLVSTSATSDKAGCAYTNLWAWDLDAKGAALDTKTVSIDQPNVFLPGSALGDTFTDFVVRAQVTLDSDDNRDGCGFIFRQTGSTNNYYVFMYQRGRTIYFSELTNNTWVKDFPSASTKQVRANNAENDVVVVVKGNDFTAYINGKQVLQYTDTSYKNGGLKLAAMHFDKGTSASCTFKNVWVWTLDN